MTLVSGHIGNGFIEVYRVYLKYYNDIDSHKHMSEYTHLSEYTLDYLHVKYMIHKTYVMVTFHCFSPLHIYAYIDVLDFTKMCVS